MNFHGSWPLSPFLTLNTTQTAVDNDLFSDLESTLSATPVTTVLDQVEVQLGLAGKAAGSESQDSELAERAIKRRRNSQGIEFHWGQTTEGRF